MRIRKPSDTRLREESATVLLPSLTFASFQWLDSHDAKRFTAIKESSFFCSKVQHLLSFFLKAFLPYFHMVLVLLAPLLVSTQILHTQISFDSLSGLFPVILCYNILFYPLSSYYRTSKNLCLYICTYFLVYVNVYRLFPPALPAC